MFTKTLARPTLQIEIFDYSTSIKYDNCTLRNEVLYTYGINIKNRDVLV